MFQKFFSNKDKTEVNRVFKMRLEDLSELEALNTASHVKPIIIFKHSTRCGISANVLRRFEKKVIEDDLEQVYNFYFLDLLKYRDISNGIAKTFELIHQSPQVLVIKNARLINHASHYDILDMNL